MGLVHAYKKGEVPASKVSQAVKDAAKSMKKKSTKDFASTKHDDLPDKVREYLMSENPAASAAAAMAMMQLQNPDTGKKVSAITPLRDKDHKLHKKSKGIFQRLKDKFMKKNESINEDVFAIVDKYNDRKQDYDQVYFKDNNLNKVKKHMKKMGKKYGKMNLIRVKSNGKMSVVENLKEDGHTDVASAERKLKLIMKDAMDTLNALNSLSNEDSLPSWWTDKITLAKDYVGKSRDYIMNPAESVDERKNPKREKLKKDFNKGLLSLEKQVRRVKQFAKSNDWGRVSAFVEDGLVNDIEDLARYTREISTLPVNENAQKVAKLLIKYGNNTKDVKDMIKKHYKTAKKDRSKSTPSELANYISFLSANESVNEGKGVEKILKMASEKSFGKIAGRTVDGMTAGLFKAVYDKAPQNAKDKIDKMSEKQLYVFMGKLWNKFGRQVKLS